MCWLGPGGIVAANEDMAVPDCAWVGGDIRFGPARGVLIRSGTSGVCLSPWPRPPQPLSGLLHIKHHHTAGSPKMDFGRAHTTPHIFLNVIILALFSERLEKSSPHNYYSPNDRFSGLFDTSSRAFIK